MNYLDLFSGIGGFALGGPRNIKYEDLPQNPRERSPGSLKISLDGPCPSVVSLRYHTTRGCPRL